MARKITTGSIAIAAALAVAGFSAASAGAAEVTIKGASCFPIGSVVSKPFEGVVKDINAAGKGVIQIKLLGGAPAIGSPFTMTQKLGKGIFDIVGCPDAYFGNVLKEAPALRLSDYTPSEMRKNGGYKYVSKLFAAKNIHFVARHSNNGPFYLWLNKKIDKPDLTGLHLRVSPVYTPFFKSLGATVQRSNIAQIYTYMENGTVQGYGWPALAWVPSWVKVTKYRVEPGFYVAPIQTLANLKKWKGLSKAQQDVITKVAMTHERRDEKYQDRLDKQNAKTAAQGLKVIRFTGADAAKWSKAAKDAGWGEVVERSPKHGPALRKLMTK